MVALLVFIMATTMASFGLKNKNCHVDKGRDPFNQNSDRSERKKWSTSNGGPVFSKLFWLYQTDPLDRAPRLSEISYTYDPLIYDITSDCRVAALFWREAPKWMPDAICFQYREC